MQEPKPKYTTIATFVKILENKGYVGRTERGKSYEYYPLCLLYTSTIFVIRITIRPFSEEKRSEPKGRETTIKNSI